MLAISRDLTNLIVNLFSIFLNSPGDPRIHGRAPADRAPAGPDLAGVDAPGEAGLLDRGPVALRGVGVGGEVLKE